MRNPNAMASPGPTMGMSKLSISPSPEKFKMPDTQNPNVAPFNPFYDQTQSVSQIDWQDRISPSARTENRDPISAGGTFLFKAVNNPKTKKKKDKPKVKKNTTVPKTQVPKKKSGQDKFLAKSDLVLMHKANDHVAKRALVEIKLGVEPEEEHDLVLDWCYQSTLKMMQVMNLKQSKNFVRKISDYLQERKNEDYGGAKANPQIYRKDKYIAGLDMIEVHDMIDETLEKIRAKIIDKALEAENTLKDFE